MHVFCNILNGWKEKVITFITISCNLNNCSWKKLSYLYEIEKDV